MSFESPTATAAKARPRTRRRSVRRALLVLLLLVLVAAAVLAVLLSRGSYGIYSRADVLAAGRRAALPSWTAWCRRQPPADGHFSCARVDGRVIWVQGKDPDGDGDRHVIVMARLRPRIVKFSRDFPLEETPGVGSRVTAVGWVQVGASGHNEIDTIHLGE